MGNYKPRLRSASYTTTRGERVFDTFETAEDLLLFLQEHKDVYVVQNLDSPRATWIAGADVYAALGYSTLTLDYSHFVAVRRHLKEINVSTHGHVNYVYRWDDTEHGTEWEETATANEPTATQETTSDLAAAIARFNAKYGSK